MVPNGILKYPQSLCPINECTTNKYGVEVKSYFLQKAYTLLEVKLFCVWPFLTVLALRRTNETISGIIVSLKVIQVMVWTD